ncbi:MULTISPECIES: hypothetical protein [Bacillaceae]|uniref:hypothetical protein n=1 Tax=Shouchella miscanthi TaxID=2598861 RepID=UPI000AA0F7C4|nr:MULTISPECIES: hypothetical protein [Bacillaceae]
MTKQQHRKMHLIGYLIFLVLLAICYFAVEPENFFVLSLILIGGLAIVVISCIEQRHVHHNTLSFLDF